MASGQEEESVAAEAARDEIRGVVGGIREGYLRLGAVIERVAARKLFRPLGFKTLKAFLDEECDVTSGPSASVARRINHFLSVDAKEALGARKEDYERLARACHSVASEKLKELEKHKDLVTPENLDEIVGNLENLPTKAFKNTLRQMKERNSDEGASDVRGPRRQGGKASRKLDPQEGPDPEHVDAAGFDGDFFDASSHALARGDPDARMVVKVVRKTFTVPREAEETIERALALAEKLMLGKSVRPEGGGTRPEHRKDLALVELCRMFERMAQERGVVPGDAFLEGAAEAEDAPPF